MSDYSTSLEDILSYSRDIQNTDTEFDSAMIMPPPNVTGNLHIGHGLNLFLQDILVRFDRLHNNQRTLWIPGTDHAGIATQLLVQKELKKNSIEYTPDSLNTHIWEWKEVYEKNICEQLRALGVSVNWDHYLFTLDEDPQTGVTEAFCRLYESGIIFRGNKMLNWDVELQSVISDIETVNKELDGTLYYIDYISEDGDPIQIATVRPETIFADEALVVHPDDERYKHLVGKRFFVPLTNRLVPLITDLGCEIDKGTGALKIDPAHGFMDFEIAIKHNLPVIPVIDKRGRMVAPAPDYVAGKDRFEARKIVASKLEETGALHKKENIKHLVPHGCRSDSVLEPMILDQWFLDMPKIKDRAREIIESGEIELTPSSFKSIYLEYVNKLQPWCISRQISWGHKIPAWYENDKVYVARSYEEAKRMANTQELTQDPDVLDTWFSSALWPMLTLGWPNKELKAPLYPNANLVTGHDILFFWATKMIIMHIGLFGDKGVPFKSIKLHGLVQDEHGLKMSKSKGNVVNPISLCKEYGTDVVSFALIYTATTGHNIKFGNQNIDKSKKFLNKIWNALNLCLTNLSKERIEISSELNHDIIRKLAECENSIAQKVNNWNIYGAADDLYSFFWNDFCSWYLEVSKWLNSTEFRTETQYCLYYLFRKILKIMHPFLPVITEYFWQKLGENKDILRNYTELVDPQFEAITNSKDGNVNYMSVHKFRSIVNKVRSLKDQFQLQANENLFIQADFPVRYLSLLNFLTRLNIRHKDENEILEESVKFGLDGIKLELITSDKVNFHIKLKNIIENINKNIELLRKQLKDDGFMTHAGQELITQKRNQLLELEIDLKVYKHSAEETAF